MFMRLLPNALSVFRLAAAPCLLALGWVGAQAGFLALLTASLASDAVDGWLARRLGVTSVLGARLDSRADLATYGVLPVAVFWLRPDAVANERAWIALALAAFAVPIAIGWIRFARLTSYHTIAAKVTAVAMGVGLLALLVLDSALLFRVACAMLVFEAIEEVAITRTLPRWTADVPTLARARAIARGEVERAR